MDTGIVKLFKELFNIKGQKLTRDGSSMVFEYTNDQKQKTIFKLYLKPRSDVGALEFHVDTQGSGHNGFFIDEESITEETSKHPLPEEMLVVVRERIKACEDEMRRRQPYLIAILHEVLGDTTITLDAKNYPYCNEIYEIDLTKNGDEIARQIAVTNILENHWKNKTPRYRRHFYPNGSSLIGFLQWGEVLEDVIARDANTLSLLGKSQNEVGLKLKKLLDTASQALLNGDFSFSDDIYEVDATYWMGYQTCPFNDCKNQKHDHSYGDFTIKNKVNGKSIRLPGLVWHLISEHGFFEGNTEYRVVPENLIQVLYGL